MQKALEKFESTMLRGHLNSCVPEGIREGRADQVIDELAELYELARK